VSRFKLLPLLPGNTVEFGNSLTTRNLFVRDRQTGTTQVVATTLNGQPVAASFGYGDFASVSNNGRVTFRAKISDMVAGSTDDLAGLFVRDLQAGTTTLASIDPSGNRLNNIVGALISADGKSVVFNKLGASAGSELYVRNLETGVTKLVLNGGAGSSAVLVAPSISANGRFISYVNIGSPNNSPLLILYVYDSQSQTTNQVATAPISGGSLKGDSISDDGRYVSYISNSGAFVLDRGDSFGNIPITGGAEIALLNGNFPNNQAPVVTQQIVSYSIVKGNVFSISVANNFADPDAGEVLSYTAKLANGDPLPAWLGFDPKNGSFSGTPGAGDAANLSVVVRAIDKGGLRAPITFNLDVNNGNFNAPLTSPGVANVGNVIVGDFNGDGKADLATIPAVNFITYRGSPKISILLGNGSGSFGAATEYAVGSPYVAQPETLAISPVAIASGDFNGDGKTDLVTLNNVVNQTTKVSLLLANSNGGLDPQINVFTGSGSQILTGDFNNDQKQDILIANDTATNATVLLGNGSGGFSTPISSTVSSTINSAAAPFIGDFNNDSKLDYATYYSRTFGESAVSISLGKGDGSFNAPIVSLPNSGEIFFEGAVFGDFNGDGKLDFVSSVNNIFKPIPGSFVAFLGDGTGNFSASAPVLTNNLPSARTVISLITGDFNSDGKLDLAGASLGKILIYEGLGNGQFKSGVSDSASGLVSGDFNGDGKADLAGVGATNTTVSLNNGSNSTSNSVAGINFGPDGASGVGFVVPAAQNAANLDFDATGILGMFDADAGQNKFNTTVTPGLGAVGNLTITPEGAFAYHLDSSKAIALPLGRKGEVFTVTSFDGTASRDIMVSVLGKNDAPIVVTPLANRDFSIDTSFSFSVKSNFSDPDLGDTLTYRASGANWLTLDPNTGLFVGSPTILNTGPFNIVVTATDSNKLSVSSSFTLNVSGANNVAPVAKTIANQTIRAGSPFRLDLAADTFTDANANDLLTYSAKLADGSDLPAWLTFNPFTRVFSGKPLNKDVANLNLAVIATDAAGAIGTSNFALNVALPIFNPTPPSIITNQIVTTRDTEIVVTKAMLEATSASVGIADSELVYTISRLPISGILRFNAGALAEGGTFTQADINSGKLTYRSRGTSPADGFGFTITDGTTSVAPGGIFSNQLVSINTAGDQALALGASPFNPVYGSVMSADGRYVAFITSGKLADGDTNAVDDIYIRDLVNGTTELVLANSGVADVSALSISADGRYLGYRSNGGVVNGFVNSFVYDRQTNTNKQVSLSTAGVTGNQADSSVPIVSADGRYAFFSSRATNLVPNDTNAEADIFVRDLQANTTERAVLDSTGAQIKGVAFSPSLSADGRYLAFVSTAPNIVPGVAISIVTRGNAYVKDLQDNTIKLVSIDGNGQPGNGSTSQVVISADGRYVAFSSNATNFGPASVSGEDSVYVHDLQTGITEAVTVSADGSALTRLVPRRPLPLKAPAISADGRYVSFFSKASNLIAGVDLSQTDGQNLFVRDRQTNTTRLVTVSATGAPSNQLTPTFSNPSISADGRYISFASDANNLAASDNNDFVDIFVRDLSITNANGVTGGLNIAEFNSAITIAATPTPPNTPNSSDTSRKYCH
jgi:VCBS repeat-containing protein